MARIWDAIFVSENSGKVLDVPTVTSYQALSSPNITSTGGKSAVELFPTGEAVTYFIAPAIDPTLRGPGAHPRLCLDVRGASQENEALVQLWGFHGGPNQQFRMEDLGNMFYRFKSVHSNKYLDVQRGSQDQGAQVWPIPAE